MGISTQTFLVNLNKLFAPHKFVRPRFNQTPPLKLYATIYVLYDVSNEAKWQFVFVRVGNEMKIYILFMFLE